MRNTARSSRCHRPSGRCAPARSESRTRPWVAERHAGGDGEGGENHAEPQEHLGQIALGAHDQEWGETLAEQQGTDPETHHDDAGRESGPLGKPTRCGRHRCHVAEADADASHDAVADIEQEQGIDPQGETRERVAAGEHDTAGHGEQTRADARQQRAGDGGGHAKGEDRGAERPGRPGVGPAEIADQQGLEKAPCVHRAEAEL